MQLVAILELIAVIFALILIVFALINNDKQRENETLSERNQRVIVKYIRIIAVTLILFVIAYLVQLIF